MQDEHAFLQAIRANPQDDLARLAYADWLQGRADLRGEFLQLGVALRSLPPDHIQRPTAEQEVSRMRASLDAEWLAGVGLDTQAQGPKENPDEPVCDCFHHPESAPWPELDFHTDVQDTECDAWKRLLDLIEEAARDGRKDFAPLADMDWDQRRQIVTLPPTIGKLKEVHHLLLYRSFLVRLPPEIGGMESLETFTPYTSWRLHWFPYEITRCTHLKDSTVSTRVLYGNFKHRPPFPELDPSSVRASAEAMRRLGPRHGITQLMRNCSVCDQLFEDAGLHRVWISLRVATDVLPLLVNACSEECIASLPRPADRYIPFPHRGGLEVQQPPDEIQAQAKAEAAELEQCEADLQLDPTNWDALRTKARHMISQQRYDEAIECWDRLLAGLPSSELDLGDNDFIITLSGSLIFEPPRSEADYLGKKADCLKELRRFDEALELLRQAQRIAGSRGSRDIGDLLREMGRWEEALAEYECCFVPWPVEALATPPERPRWTLRPWTLLRAIEKRILMNGRAGRVVPMPPGLLDTLANLTLIHLKCLCLGHLKRWLEADQVLDPAHLPREGPNRLELNNLRPLVKFMLGDVEGATRALHAFLGSEPYYRPLDDERRTVFGLEAPEDYCALAESVYASYAHLRQE